MATSTNKTAAFGVKLIHKCMSKHRYIQKNLLFGALYGLVESFFKNDEGHNVTVNADRYRTMITNFFIPELNNHDVQQLWFQQDGATCHTDRATIDLLKDTLGDRLISRFGPVNWPPRSCDLTPLDYFLWGYVKSLVYADKPQTLDHLEDKIRHVIADIRPQMLEKEKLCKPQSEAKNLVFQAKTSFCHAKSFKWPTTQTSEGQYPRKLPLCPTGWLYHCQDFLWGRDGEPVARVPSMARDTIFWACQR
ncbi:putative transposable element [Trichonephila clavipes]|nr:putative transposable element [Trichonephila clavipes]